MRESKSTETGRSKIFLLQLKSFIDKKVDRLELISFQKIGDERFFKKLYTLYTIFLSSLQNTMRFFFCGTVLMFLLWSVVNLVFFLAPVVGLKNLKTKCNLKY